MYKYKINKNTPDAVSLTVFLTKQYMEKLNNLQMLYNANNGKMIELLIDKYISYLKKHPEEFKDDLEVFGEKLNIRL